MIGFSIGFEKQNFLLEFSTWFELFFFFWKKIWKFSEISVNFMWENQAKISKIFKTSQIFFGKSYTIFVSGANIVGAYAVMRALYPTLKNHIGAKWGPFWTFVFWNPIFCAWCVQIIHQKVFAVQILWSPPKKCFFGNSKKFEDCRHPT